MKKRIVVADDDPAILDALSMMLEDEGYEVVATCEEEKLFEVNGKNPDMFLLDIWMSGMDGKDICRRLKIHPHFKHTPVVLVSAHRDTETIAKEAGADGFVCKPFNIDEMIKTIKTLTGEEME